MKKLLPSLLLISFTILMAVSCSNKSSESTLVNTNPKEISLHLISSFSTNLGKPSSAEIVSFDPDSKRLFVVNSVGNKLDILNFSNPEKIRFIRTVDLGTYGIVINSVSVKNKLVAAAIQHPQVDKEGSVVFFDIEGNYLQKVLVGVLPDMLTFSPDGSYILVANEGEPSDDYKTDPEGSVSIIEIPANNKSISQSNVVNLNFRTYNDSLKSLRAQGVRIFGPGASVAQDLEPEYISISPDSKKAWVTLQENNAVAVVDISLKKITSIRSLGTRNYSMQKESCTLQGMHQPDGIASFSVDGKNYIITANEGEPRMYEGFKELQKLENPSYSLDKEKFPSAPNKNMGKLGVSSSTGDVDGDGDFDEIHCYGSRSFSIWDEQFKLIYDSGDGFEKVACKEGEYCKFNERYAKIAKEEKLDLRGPEPESVVTGKIGDKNYAFITLERYGGIMAYNVDDPTKAYFVDYANSNIHDEKREESRPEGIIFIPSDKSPNGKNLIVVANEGTSMVDVYEVR